ncbi:MAG: hypothetical protein LM590_10695 [Thermofilum sp.]|nr:hypothetical protein [Thermofilum sp.]
MAEVIVRIEAGGVFTVQVVGAEDEHEVSDVVVDSVNLRKTLELGLGEVVVIYLEAVEVRVYGEEKAVITTKRPS